MLYFSPAFVDSPLFGDLVVDNPVDYCFTPGFLANGIVDPLWTESPADESLYGTDAAKAQPAHLEEMDRFESATSETTPSPKLGTSFPELFITSPEGSLRQSSLSKETSQTSQEAQRTTPGQLDRLGHSRHGVEVSDLRESMSDGSNGSSPGMRLDNEERTKRLLKRNRSWDDIERKKRRQS